MPKLPQSKMMSSNLLGASIKIEIVELTQKSNQVEKSLSNTLTILLHKD